MKIFSNFDTNIRSQMLQQYQAEFWEANVLCFGRSRLYFLLKVFFPTIFIVAVVLLLCYLFSTVLEWDAFWWGTGILIFLSLFLAFPILDKYIDYHLDFVIVTPHFLMMFDQEWFFKKKVMMIQEISIRTISVEKSWLLYSIFNNWDIVFMSENDQTYGEFILRRVPKPEKRRNQIAQIMSKD